MTVALTSESAQIGGRVRPDRRKHGPPSRAAAGHAQRIPGVLLRVNPQSGYGFIRPDDATVPEHFCHIKAFWPRSLFADGQRVSFQPGPPHTGPGRKAPAAVSACAESELENPPKGKP